jgi:hypothetical protein
VGLGYYELKQHMPMLEENCSGRLVEKKQAEVNWVQIPSEINMDNLSNTRREASRRFRNKKS